MNHVTAMTAARERGQTMICKKKLHKLKPDQPEMITGGTGGLGVYRPGFPYRYKKESLRFFKGCVGEDVYLRAIGSDAGREHHYTVARAFLDQEEWEKFVWIEEYGSLDGFPKK